ncbi:putative F-box/LRR-repeat protein [Trifolium repens]|nr:putative F-box/LRR-repeat protein [Trifolium repens]
MKRCKKLKLEKLKFEFELPDCVISYIFSMLSLKDLVKTSALSKRWIYEWRLRMDLNFDLHNMFDYNTIQNLPTPLPFFQWFHFQSEFATRLDQFMLHYQGHTIRSIRLDFPLCNHHTDLIDRLISKGIAKGVKRIELLLSEEKNIFRYTYMPLSPYTFPLTLLSDSLTYLHLQNCFLAEPTDFSGLKNLTTIVLDGLYDTLSCLVSISVDALNLSSFEYSGTTTKISVVAPRLLMVFWESAASPRTPHPLSTIARLTHIENLAMIISPSQVEKITETLVRFQNLRQLNLLIKGAYNPNMDYFWILDITMASQYLQQLSLTIRNPRQQHLHMNGVKRQKREYAGFSHNNLKYVKFCGCVCYVNVIELASNLLRNMQMLKEDVNEQCQLIIL